MATGRLDHTNPYGIPEEIWHVWEQVEAEKNREARRVLSSRCPKIRVRASVGPGCEILTSPWELCTTRGVRNLREWIYKHTSRVYPHCGGWIEAVIRWPLRERKGIGYYRSHIDPAAAWLVDALGIALYPRPVNDPDREPARAIALAIETW